MSLNSLLSLPNLPSSSVALGSRARGSEDRRGKLRDAVAMVTFAPMTLVFFWRLVFLEETSVPRGGGDLASFLYPVYSYAAASLQNGVLPLWNPHLYSGSPFAADMQSGLFYPINLLAFVLARPFTYVTMEQLAVVHFFLGCCFAYLYARSLGVGRIPSFATGVIFAFGGFMTAHLGHLNMIAAAIWLPLILLFFHRAVTKGSIVSAVFSGAVFAVSILAGHTQITLYIAFSLFLYWLWHVVFPDSRRSAGASRPISARWLRIASLPVAGAVAFAASAIQLLPTYELVRLSVRADLTYAKASEYAASPTGLITLLIPHFFGENPQAFWGLKWNLTEVYGYVGILPLLLIPLAIVLRKRDGGAAPFFAVLAVLSLLLSLGEYTVLHGLLYRFVPGFDKVRAAGRFLLLLNFAVAVLAGVGLDGLSRRLSRRDRPWYRLVTNFNLVVLAGSVFLAAPFYYHALLTSQDKDPVIFQRVSDIINSLNLSMLFLAAGVLGLAMFPRLFGRRQLMLSLAVLLIVVDLFSANAGFNPTTEEVLTGYGHPEVVRFLKAGADQELARVDSVTNVWDAWQPDATLLYQLDDVMGIFNPMLLADYNVYWEALGSRSTPAYDILNARYVVAHKDVVLDWDKFRPVLVDAPGVNVYENTRSLPRALLVPAVEVMGRDKMLERLRGKDFDPRKLLLVEEAVPGLPAGNADGFAGRVLETKRPSPNEIVARTDSSRPALLQVADAYYPGWTALVDGTESKVIRSDYMFKSVLVPAGAHEVKLVFKPRLLEIGAAISGLAWLILIGLVAKVVWWSGEGAHKEEQ